MNNRFDNFFSEDMMGSSDIFPIISLDESSSEISIQSGDVLPVLPLRNMVIFPGVLLPVSVARTKSLKLVRHAHENETLIAVCTQIDKKDEDQKEEFTKIQEKLRKQISESFKKDSKYKGLNEFKELVESKL